MAEKGRRWSPYVYGFDDPIRFIDPDGMWPDWGAIYNFVTRPGTPNAAGIAVLKGARDLAVTASEWVGGQNSHRAFDKDPKVRAEAKAENIRLSKELAFNAAMGYAGGKLFGMVGDALAGKVSGSWVSESTSGWSKASVSYQEQITGVKAGSAFEVNGVKFDGVSGGKLLEAKGSYDGFVNNKTGEFQSWFKGADGLVDQAGRQIEAANGAPIEWNFSSQKSLNATKALFKENDITGITLKYTPAK